MNGKPYESGVFGGSMRRYLFCEHLGIEEEDEEAINTISDPVSEDFFTSWCNTAAKNTQIFEEVVILVLFICSVNIIFLWHLIITAGSEEEMQKLRKYQGVWNWEIWK